MPRFNGRGRQVTWSIVLSSLIIGVSAAQESALERAQNEAARLRQAPKQPEETIWKNIKATREPSAGLHASLRDWVASLLPKSRVALDAELLFLTPKVDAELRQAGLFRSGASGDPFEAEPGTVTRMEFSRPPEDPDKLVVIVGVDVPCGSNDAAYIYDYSQGEPRLVLESHGTRDHDEGITNVRFSKRDASGSQLILTLRYAVQCGSSWNMLSYDLFRLSTMASAAVPILGGEQGIWFAGAHPYHLRIEPDELLMEVQGSSIDANIHNREHVLHFNAPGSTAERVDPVALQPQDFVDEWFTRPWSEMESRSAESARDKLQKWHDFLSGDFVAGEFQFVQRCREPADQWQIAIDLGWIKSGELPDGLRVYFLVQQSGHYRFTMTGISFERQEGCPGESDPNIESPTLFPADERH